MKLFRSIQQFNRKPARRFKTHRRFRLSFINENTFNQVWTIKMSQTRVVISILILLFAIGCVVSTLIVFTPIRTLLPGYLKHSQLQENLNNNARLDSLTAEAAITNAYLANIATILSGNIDTSIVVNTRQDSTTQLPVDSIIGASDAEKQFVRQFEDKEKFNLSVLSPLAAEGLSFFPPVATASVDDETSDVLGVTLIASRNAAVSSIYSGTIVDCYYTSTNGYTIIVQHPNGFLSKYSGMGDAFVQKGDKVNTGARIGLCGKQDYSGRTLPLTIELWHKGTPLNPRDYIAF